MPDQPLSPFGGNTLNLEGSGLGSPGTTARDTAYDVRERLKAQMTPGQRAGLALQAFGSAYTGQKPMIETLVSQQLALQEQQRKSRLADFELLDYLVKYGQRVPEKERDAWVQAASGQFGNPDMAILLQRSLSQIDTYLPEYVMSDPVFSLAIKNDPSLKTFTTMLTSKEGMQRLEKAADRTFVPTVRRKIPAMLEHLKAEKPKIYDALGKDGKVTIDELTQANEAAAEPYKLTPQELSAITAPRNGPELTALGDQTGFVMEPIRQQYDAKDEYIRLIQHKDELLKQIGATADPGKKALLNQQLGEIQQRIDKMGTIVGRTEFDQPTRSQAEGVRAELQQVRRASEAIRDFLGEARKSRREGKPLTGVVASFRKLSQTVLGMAEDIASATGISLPTSLSQFENREPSGFFQNDPNLPELRLFEEQLRFIMARIFQPEGKLLASTVERANAVVNITGAVSQDDAEGRLEGILRFLTEIEQDKVARLQGKPPENVKVKPIEEMSVSELSALDLDRLTAHERQRIRDRITFLRAQRGK